MFDRSSRPIQLVQIDMKPFWYIFLSLGLLIVICTSSITARLDHNSHMADVRADRSTERLEKAVATEVTIREVRDLRDTALLNQATNADLRAMLVQEKVRALLSKDQAQPQ